MSIEGNGTGIETIPSVDVEQEREGMSRAKLDIPRKLDLRDDPLSIMPDGSIATTSVSRAQVRTQAEALGQSQPTGDRSTSRDESASDIPLTSLYARDNWLDGIRKNLIAILSAGTQVSFKLTGYHIVITLFVITMCYLFVSNRGYEQGKNDAIVQQVENLLQKPSK
jgi:hypothetical protein